MHLEIAAQSERGVAVRAGVRLLARVDAHVSAQLERLEEVHVAVEARVQLGRVRGVDASVRLRWCQE